MPKIGGKRKKTRTHVDDNEELPKEVPRSMIIKRGRVGPYVSKIIKELRTTMYPYTAINLKESQKNNMKDFLSLVDVYGLSHLMIFTNTEKASYLKLAKLPAGPTITFKIDEFCLVNDILESNKRAKPLLKSFFQVPLVIMNNFNSSEINEEFIEPVKISGMLLQSFFPPIDISEIDVNKCKRALMFNLNADEEEPTVEFRHYKVEREKYSIKKTISNILNLNKKDLSKFKNISDYVLKASGFTSGSDFDEPNLGVVENEASNKTKVKLYECGPRLNLKIFKIEEGFLKGNVVYHRIIKKSKKEIREIMQEVREKKKLKKERAKEQLINVKKKEEKKLLEKATQEQEAEMKNEGEEEEDEEKKQKIIEHKLKALKKEKKKEQMLNRKREKEKKKSQDRLIPKKELRMLKNLQKGK